MQVEGEGVLVVPDHLHLHRELWQRQHHALQRGQPEAAEAAAAAKQHAIQNFEDLQQQPPFVRGGHLQEHQLQVGRTCCPTKLPVYAPDPDRWPLNCLPSCFVNALLVQDSVGSHT